MTTAKIFQHGGSQAVRLPKAFRFSGSEVHIEKHGDEVVLRPVTNTRFKSFTGIARLVGTVLVGIRQRNPILRAATRCMRTSRGPQSCAPHVDVANSTSRGRGCGF